MVKSEPDYESRLREILQFVFKNPDCTKSDVIRHMKGRSAVTTTHAILKDMIREGKINVYKKNLQTHLLNINPGFDFKRMELNLLTSSIKRIQKQFEPISMKTEGVNTELINTLLKEIDFFQEKYDSNYKLRTKSKHSKKS